MIPIRGSRLGGLAPQTHIILDTNSHSDLSMAAEERTAPETGMEPSSEFGTHEMRITQGGKIRAWVEFALKFFEACKAPVHPFHYN